MDGYESNTDSSTNSNVISIEGRPRPKLYDGITKKITIMPAEASDLEIMINTLDLLKAEALEFYKRVEKNLDRIYSKESDVSGIGKGGKTIYISRNDIKKGRVATALTLVHELKHKELTNVITTYDQEEGLCYQEEQKLLQRLGDKYAKEAGIDKEDIEVHAGKQILGWLILQAELNEKNVQER